MYLENTSAVTGLQLSRGVWACRLSVVNLFRVHIMPDQPVKSDFLPFRTGFPVVAVGVNGKAASGQELAGHLNVFGIHQGNQVLHDLVDTVLMEIAVVPVGEQI